VRRFGEIEVLLVFIGILGLIIDTLASLRWGCFFDTWNGIDISVSIILKIFFFVKRFWQTICIYGVKIYL
jgi:hypothetical protein